MAEHFDMDYLKRNATLALVFQVIAGILFFIPCLPWIPIVVGAGLCIGWGIDFVPNSISEPVEGFLSKHVNKLLVGVSLLLFVILPLTLWLLGRGVAPSKLAFGVTLLIGLGMIVRALNVNWQKTGVCIALIAIVGFFGWFAYGWWVWLIIALVSGLAVTFTPALYFDKARIWPRKQQEKLQ